MQALDVQPRQQTDDSLEAFVAPAGIAVVGASTEPHKLGFALARNLVASGYKGGIHFVNPRGGELFGRKVFRNLEEVPDPVDLAVILTPALTTPEVIEACGRRGIGAAIIASGGFRETGDEGARLEEACLEAAHRHGMRLMGPNCIGVFDAHVPFDTTFLQPPGPMPGEVAFISHSGAICAAMVDWANGMGLGLSRLVSLGNQADVDETAMLALAENDEHTRVITMYLEGVSNGQAFVLRAAEVSRSKPVVALKVGRTDAGRRAAASHTGAMAGAETAVDAAFRRAGILRAPGTQELLEWARALAWSPLPAGENVAVLTNAGGPGVATADAINAHGLLLAELGAPTRHRLKALLPEEATLTNPVDMLASASPEQYADCLDILLRDPSVDAVVVLFPPPPGYPAPTVVHAMTGALNEATKPVVVVVLGDHLVEKAALDLQSLRVPDFRYPERAVAALAALRERARFLDRSSRTRRPDDLHAAAAESVIVTAQTDDDGFLNATDAARLLRCYGIDVLETVLAATPANAAETALRVGFPVAIKLASPDVQHKSDIGGVLIDIGNELEAAEAAAAILSRARVERSGARLDGVLIQRMAPPGQEVIVGAVRDPQFGPLVMFGSGGIEVEGLDDVAFSLAPATDNEIEEMIEVTWAGKKLGGYRSIPPADRVAIEDAIRRLGHLTADFTAIQEIEINPLRVLGPGEGAVAIDVRVRLSTPNDATADPLRTIEPRG